MQYIVIVEKGFNCERIQESENKKILNREIVWVKKLVGEPSATTQRSRVEILFIDGKKVLDWMKAVLKYQTMNKKKKKKTTKYYDKKHTANLRKLINKKNNLDVWQSIYFRRCGRGASLIIAWAVTNQPDCTNCIKKFTARIPIAIDEF